jgi:Domain of unknown function (DUF4123)
MDNPVQKLREYAFSQEEENVFAVLDGARIGRPLQLKLQALKPEHTCLYRGELKPDLAECAPYLARLEPEGEFTDWVLTEGWGKAWGVLAVTASNLIALRKHFRTFLLVKNPEGKQVYFRYYDPRVLRVFLPTCNPEETQAIFGPVSRYLIEDEDPRSFLAFHPEDGLPKRETIQLSDA